MAVDAYAALHLTLPGIVEAVVGVPRGYAGKLLDRLNFAADAALGCGYYGWYCALHISLVRGDGPCGWTYSLLWLSNVLLTVLTA